MKILIAVPTFESICPDTFQSIYDLDPGGHQLMFRYVRGFDCAAARNRIAQIALDCEADFVLMVDSDVILSEDVLVNLLDDTKDVCLGYYAHRNEDNMYYGRTCVCRQHMPDNNLYLDYPIESQYKAAELISMRDAGFHKIRVHGGGMGCALIRTEVFRQLSYPWFAWVNYDDDTRNVLSEDLYFCEQLKNANIPIYTDTRAGCGHVLRHVQWPV